jgi:hypothetical protein
MKRSAPAPPDAAATSPKPCSSPPEDLARIATITAELGWDQARLDAFLRSGSSPLKHRASIRTQADANKVWWALKRIRDRQKKAVAGI